MPTNATREILTSMDAVEMIRLHTFETKHALAYFVEDFKSFFKIPF